MKMEVDYLLLYIGSMEIKKGAEREKRKTKRDLRDKRRGEILDSSAFLKGILSSSFILNLFEIFLVSFV